MKFSICIPNFNYAHYLGLTFESIRNQEFKDYEVVISDNASTDGSIDLIKEASKKFSNFNYQVNKTNIGFAPNLDKAAELASGDYMIMLSSDDLMEKQALSCYADLLTNIPNAVLSSAWDIIDSNGKNIGRNGPKPAIWKQTDIDAHLSEIFKCDVYKVKSNTILNRSLLTMSTPFNFCTVAYSRRAYEQCGGYEATRLINPDKWFHWKLLTKVEDVIYIDKSLFSYRWHNQNQSAQQQNTGYLKYMVDEYRNTMEITTETLAFAGIKKFELINAFIKRDVYQHGLGEFSKGRWLKSLRIFFFGLSTYPGRMIKNRYFILYILALLTSPLGSWLIHKFRK
jgi:glycosyltransferase involved in cell wall biosynthesis